MRIKVMYQDERIGQVESYELDALIASLKIKKFRRGGEWVTIGVDPIRQIREDYLERPEKQNLSGKKKKSTKPR